MQLTSSLLLFAIGASAAATPRHAHQRLHEKRAVGDVVTAVIDGKVVHWINEYDGGATAAAQPTGASPPAAAGTAPAPQVATSGNSAASSPGVSAGNSKSLKTFTPFCASSSSKAKRATLGDITYKGNVGSVWGCNIQLVDASIADKYDHVIKFNTQSASEQSCVCWNKIGPKGGLTGWFGTSAVSFNLPVGTEQYVAVDANTQGGCSCGAGSVPVDTWGEWAATWLEFDMANSKNGGASGSDVSALVPMATGMGVQGMSVCTADGSQCSSLKQGATDVKAAYVKGMEAEDGVGINLAPGKVQLNVIVDYQ